MRVCMYVYVCVMCVRTHESDDFGEMQSSRVRSTTIKMQNCCVCSVRAYRMRFFAWTHTFALNICPFKISDLFLKNIPSLLVWEHPVFIWCFSFPFYPRRRKIQAVLAKLWKWMWQWWLWFSSKHPQLGAELNSHDVCKERDNWALNLSQAEKYFHTLPVRTKGVRNFTLFLKKPNKADGKLNVFFQRMRKKAKFNAPSPRFVLVTAAGRIQKISCKWTATDMLLLKSQPYQPITHKLPLFCKTTISWHQVFLKKWPTQWFPLISLFSAQLSLLLSPSFLFVPPVQLPTDKIAFFSFWCKICQTKL